MPLGYCMTCDTLRSIRPGEQKWGSREVAWYPIEHDKPPTHKKCGAKLSTVLTEEGDLFGYVCLSCSPDEGATVPAVEVDKGPCDGSRRAIVSKPGER